MAEYGHLTENEITLFHQGKDFRCYRKFGAHAQGGKGFHLALWAPRVKSVHVIGEFDGWRDGIPMACVDLPGGSQSDIWTCFVPGAIDGMLYKFRIETLSGEVLYKADPFAFFAEKRPGTASRLAGPNTLKHRWNDEEWIKQRKSESHFKKPMNIYEVHLGSWKQHGKNAEDPVFFSYRELAKELTSYVKDMGYTHVELMPVMEHPFDGSWGYQTTGYYAPTSRYGLPKDFKYLIDCFHQAGIGVILDWVPGHFCRDAHGLCRFNGSELFESEEHVEWGTYKFDYSRPEVRSFLISNAIFWLEEYHVDGIRVDGVSSMLYLNYGIDDPAQKRFNHKGGEEDLVAQAFLQELNEVIGRLHPDVFTVAEESTAWPLVTYPTEEGGLGFHYKWDMGWMNDTLNYFRTAPEYRPENYHKLTFSMMYYYDARFLLPLSHDEVVHGKATIMQKMSGDYEYKFPQARSLYMYMYAHPGKKLNFMGNEIGQFREWDEKREQDWMLLDYPLHAGFARFMKDLNKLYLEHSAFWEKDYEADGFQWIDCHQEGCCIYVFERRSKKERMISLFNFSDQEQVYELHISDAQKLKELLNSNLAVYGGTQKRKSATKAIKDGKIVLTLPPYSSVYYLAE